MNGSALRVWLVDDDASIRWVLERALRNDGMAPRAFEAAEPALDALRRDTPDVLITDIRMPGASGLELLRRIRDARPALPVIVMTAHSDLGSAVSAYEGGAFEYLPKPFDIDHAVDLVRRAARARPQGNIEAVPVPRIPQLRGSAPAMQQVFRAIGRLARSSVTVLITGESGTGKEIVARALHDHSPRAGKPFIALNTSAIPADLLESELFGHEKGSFTGADAQRRGRFEQSDGGTLFLDEIGDMSTPLQTRLLRVLAEGEFYRVGGQTPIRVDVRVIAATHQNLQTRVERGLFREDLYHRLNVIRIELPPLRARAEDIPDLLDHYLRFATQELAVAPKVFATETVAKLAAYSWPGNVRELRNAMERAVILVPARRLGVDALPERIAAHATVAPRLGGDFSVDQIEREHIERVISRAPTLEDAAKILGIDASTLYRKRKRYDV
jgi:two-component system nitrogen regulation response regulator GlnG